ncbi:thioredoxin-like protein [Lentinus tigrinus ALCF2SS1-7]|uniref:Thioredoxin-like protein n=1 Tax=Lentinus tigrinus ALCF2SS1-6 TaxID=1328759 RepID=A0A5C2S8W6_9APHY|nr:thioredoxin-like protein [Lentinus tigrinus ALCF2SS1-6]RPD74896.1 thioredoxin-like protein [Lentinus tigrinus ALCF2SS1-7]
MSGQQITFYTAAYSPFSERVRLALDEAGAKYTVHEFDKGRTKPEWYYKINPLGKIPAITYGGPEVPSDQPSPESAKLFESLPLLEFIAEIYPDAHLLPSDPVLRTKARTFIQLYVNYVHDPFKGAFFLGSPAEPILQAIEKLQQALAPTGFAVGQFSIADIAVAPFVMRMMLFLKTGLGAYSNEEGQKMRDAIGSEKFARFRQYIQDLHERPSIKNHWDEALQIELWKNHPGFQRKAAKQPVAA